MISCSGTTKGIAPNQTCWVLKGSATDNQYCPAGGVLRGFICYQPQVSSYAATATPSCPQGGTLSGGSCITTPSLTYSATSHNTYSATPYPAATFHPGTPPVYGVAPLISAAVAAYTDPSTGGTYHPAVAALYGPAPLISAAIAAYSDPVLPGAHHDATYSPAPLITAAYTDPATAGVIHPAIYNSEPYPVATVTTTYSCATGTLSVDKCLIPATVTPAVHKVLLTLTATNALLIKVDGAIYTAPVDVTACTVDHTVTATGPGGSITKTVACTKP